MEMEIEMNDKEIYPSNRDEHKTSWNKKDDASNKFLTAKDDKSQRLLSSAEKTSYDPLTRKDRGYAWLIVLSSFMVHVFLAGIVFTIGVTFVIFLDEFKTSKGVTAWVGSICRASLSFIAPVSSMLTNKFGSRPIVILGGVISAIGLGTSALATDIYHLYITFGIVGGGGLGLAFVPATSIINEYFDTKRTLAFGIATSGMGVGTFLYPPLIDGLNRKYGWRGMLLILSGIGLNICVCGVLMRPFTLQKQMTESDRNTVFNIKILKSFNLVLFCLNFLTFYFGLSVVFTHLSEYSLLQGVGETESAMLFSAYGITNLGGKILFGAIASHPRVNAMLLYIGTHIIAGIATVFVPLLRQYGPLLAYSSAFGLFSSTIGVLAPGIVCQILGPNELASGYGVLLPFSAFGKLLGGPVAGFMYDTLHSYNSSFFVGGGIIILSALTMVVPYFREKHNQSKNGKKDMRGTKNPP